MVLGICAGGSLAVVEASRKQRSRVCSWHSSHAAAARRPRFRRSVCHSNGLGLSVFHAITTGALRQAQAEATREAQLAGIAHARQDTTKYRGRKPSYTGDQIKQVEQLASEAANVSTISRTTGLTRQTVLRILGNPAEAYQRVAKWDAGLGMLDG